MNRQSQFLLLLGEGEDEVMSYRYNYNKNLVKLSKANRKDQTDAEKLLWKNLRGRLISGYKFRRQYPMLNYILDFYCVEKKLAIELGGGQHLKRRRYDAKRAQELKEKGISVVRFWDNDVLTNIDGMLECILSNLTQTLS